MSTIKEGAKQIVRLLEKLPDERFKHLISFKETQIDRFRRMAGLQLKEHKEANKNASLDDIKDIIKRTKGPLGLKKDVLQKLRATIPQDNYTEQTIKQQIGSLENLIANKHMKYYEVGDKLYQPAGNPKYYQRLLDEIQGKKNETFFTALRTVFFGK
ncbi:hypothetical protein KAFR_0D02590 [Kazachstania africana CBS 2517]|uniref:Cytochrome B pre-mRNA-processing protein 6 n=1 Tax=Kazachstania africana (strain ATCC 22294 / BCRC 22015 / CBS 2517 / CECT 1963 / NBRC 1671 / NRRL Y-8276) TaxID=1071382 RepID=H2AU56_KAZAF|nr:hypothetical protein KAFR_0D02590 [Kazachstania africana CBS 2517]CCF57906.1 hypothetical protein KAFR_0D02590 [Kazachstania africana CBS 2517]